LELVLVRLFFSSLSCLNIDVVSYVSVPAPNGRSGKTFSTYLIAQLLHTGSDLEWRSKTVKTQHTVGEGADVMWQSKFEWEYDIDDMAFLRFVHFT
jgi:phosphatidylinositol phospholipase C delta